MNREKRKEQILISSHKVFCRLGYEKTNVTELVKEAQVSRGTFYLYFKNKKQIFDSVLDQFMHELAVLISSKDFFIMQKNGDYQSMVSQDLARCLSKYRDLTWLLMFDYRNLEPDHKFKCRSFMVQLRALIKEQMSSLSENLAPNTLSVSTHCLVGCIKEFLLEWLNEAEEGFDLQKKISDLFHFIFSRLDSVRAVQLLKPVVIKESGQSKDFPFKVFSN